MRIRRLLILSVLLLSVGSLIAVVPSSLAEAGAWCDDMPLLPIEGIWEYTDDGATVLIASDPSMPGTFTVSVLSTSDCRLERGDVIARLHSSADSRQYRLSQSTHKDASGILDKYLDCLAILSSDGESIRIKGHKLKFRIQPYVLLPRFWRLVKFSEKNPLDDLPAGLVKLYPGYDHNGSLRRLPRTL